MKPTSCIYAITNTKNGKRYVGSTSDVKQRWKHHRTTLRKGNHRNGYLQKAWDHHGESAFRFDVVFLCPIHDLDSTERRFIDMWRTQEADHGYNLTPGGGTLRGKDHPSFGIPVPEERKQKIRDARAKQVVTPAMLDALKRNRKTWHGITGADHPGYKRVKSPEEIERVARSKWKAVEQLDLTTGAVVNTYTSVKSAAIALKLKTPGNISTCCTGDRAHVAGYGWRYVTP